MSPQLAMPRLRYGGSLLLLALTLCLGAAGYFGLPAEPPFWLGPLLLLAAALLWIMMRRADRMAPGGSGHAILSVILAGMAGLGYAQWRSQNLPDPAAIPPDTRVELIGWVVDIDPQTENRRRYTLRLLQHDLAIRGLDQVRIAAAKSDVTLGDVVTVTAILSPPRGPAVSGGYDFARHAFHQGLDASGYAVSRLAPATITADASLGRLVARARGWLAQRLSDAHPRYGGVMAALITGVRAEIPGDFTDALRDTGLGHILAISGLHMALLAGGAYALFGLLLASYSPWARQTDIRPVAAILALTVASAYLVLSGASTSTQRAFVMASVALVAVILRRRALTLRSVGLAAGAVTLLDPHAPTTAGFQMSFAAATILVGVAAKLQHRLAADSRLERLRAYVSGLFWTSLLAGMATGPIAAFHFQRSATFGLLANLICMPVFSLLVMPATVLSAVLAPLGLHELPGALASAGLGVIDAVTTTIAAWPGAVMGLSAVPPGILVLVVTAVALLAALENLRGIALGILLGMGLMIQLASPHPIAWFSAQGNVIAQTANGWISTDQRAGRFGEDRFRQRLGPVETTTIPSCRDGCQIDVAGWGRVIVNAAPRHLAEDCARADLVIAIGAVPSALRPVCSQTRIVQLSQRDGGNLTILQGPLGAQLHIQPAFRRRWQPELAWRVERIPRADN